MILLKAHIKKKQHSQIFMMRNSVSKVVETDGNWWKLKIMLLVRV
jgi:hypothetical protein